MADIGEIGLIFDSLIDDVDTILAIRKKALELMLAGTPIMEWEGEGTGVKRKFAYPPHLILAATTRYLKQYDPATYGYPVNNVRIFRIA